MASIQGKFQTNITTASPPTGVTNLLDGNSGNIVFTEGDSMAYTNPNMPSVLFGAVVVGFQYNLVWTCTQDFDFVTQVIDLNNGTTVAGTGTEISISAPGQGVTVGGSTNTLGLNFTSGDVSQFSIQIVVPVQTPLNSSVTLNSIPGLNPIISYTTTPTSKVYHSGGKVSITSGKVSVT
jgi:hypothetical protein